MSNQLSELLELAIPLPLTASFRQQANSYAAQFFTANTRHRMYFNSLAVLVADVYLRLLGFETDLTKPERWNAVHRLWSEGNEIELLGLGNLECCLISLEQQSVVLPVEIESDRPLIGYLFVEIDRSEKVATLMGFLPTIHPESVDSEMQITTLKSMDDLIDYLTEQETSILNRTDEIRDLNFEFSEGITINYLKNWLNNIYEMGWQPAKRNLTNVTAKKELQLGGQTFELELVISQRNQELLFVEVIIRCQNAYLPIGMQVSVPDESDIYTQTVEFQADLISIPLEFRSGEEFWIELRLNQSAIREYFIA